MGRDIDEDVKKIMRSATLIAANEVKKLMLLYAKDAMARFYSDYTPKHYKRVYNLKNAYKAYIDSESGHAAKNETKRRDRHNSVEHSVYLKVSTEYMPRDYHEQGFPSYGSPYHKAAVMFYDYMLGFHGGAFVTFRKKDGAPLANPIKWYGTIEKTLTTGKSIVKMNSKAPDKWITERFNALSANNTRLEEIMNSAFDAAFAKVSDNLDDIIKKAGL